MAPEVLIVRLSSIGDVAMTTVVLDGLKKVYPEARITWVVEPCCKDVIEGSSLVQRVIRWDKSEWIDNLKRLRLLELIKEAKTFLSQLRQTKYDIAIDLQGLLKSGIITYLSGAKRRIGLNSKEGSRVFMTDHFNAIEDRRISSEYKQIIEVLFQYKGPMKMQIALRDEAIKKRDHFLREIQIGDYLIFCPFSSRPQKNWPQEKWSELSMVASDEFGFPVIILGGKGDEPLADEIVRPCNNRAISMAGRFSLAESIAFVAGARAVVGVDTGLTHIAAGLERPTVVLLGSTCPYIEPDGYRIEVLYRALPCSPCGRRPACDGQYTCMKEITTEEVIRSLRKLLQ